jgi:FtsP/CotA-like multicopper oxidase with cupredoxin domain
LRVTARWLDRSGEKWSGSGMSDRHLPVNRRAVLAGLAGGFLTPVLAAAAQPQQRKTLTLQLKPNGLLVKGLGLGGDTLKGPQLSPGAETGIWDLASPDLRELRFTRGDQIDVIWKNQLPVPAVLNWQGLDAASAEPLLGQPALAAGAQARFRLAFPHAGTFFCDARLLGDGQSRPTGACPVIVQETEAVAVDREEILLIEDFRLRPDGSALAPGTDALDAAILYTVNRKPSLDITAATNERLRLRIINACQRNAIALKIDDHDIWVMAIDGQPSEPFLARNGQLVLVPGTRIDAFVDATKTPGSSSAIVVHDGKTPRPIARLLTSSATPRRTKPLPPAIALPSNGLPTKLDLKNALRIEVGLSSSTDWTRPMAVTTAVAPAFRAGTGRTVVLALRNSGTMPVAFHLHGHHVRLLDRLDDGWKPFWLDTVMIDAGQVQRVAFAAEHPGRWLMEAMAVDWAAPRLLRWYAVD